MMDADRIVACGMCGVPRAHQRTIRLEDGTDVTVVECMRCDRGKCCRCGHSLPKSVMACPDCGAFQNR